jgi:tetratricopeptide (TPR) repeat protein
VKRIVLVVCVLAATAAADPREEAKAHFKQGRAYQEAGAFLRAVDEFKAAYELDHRAEMLFNIAQAYRLGGDKPHAIEYFKSYLAAQPDGKAAEEARVLVAELQRQIDEAAQQQQQQQPQPPPHEDRPPPAAHVDVVVVRTSPTFRIAGIVTTGVGAIALGLGVKYGLDARSASDYFTHFTGMWSDADRLRYADGETANRDMKIAYAVGGGLVVTGALLYWWGSRLQVVPVAGPQTAGVAMAGRF